MAKRTILTVANIKQLKSFMSIKGPSAGLEKALIRDMNENMVTGLRVALAETCSRMFTGENAVEAFTKTSVASTGTQIRMYSTWPPSIYMELGYNPFDGDRDYIYPRKGLKNGAMLMAIKVSTIAGYRPGTHKDNGPDSILKNMRDRVKYLLSQRGIQGDHLKNYRRTIFRMRMQYENKSQPGLFKLYGEKHIKYMGERKLALKNTITAMHEYKRAWNSANDDYNNARDVLRNYKLRMKGIVRDPKQRAEKRMEKKIASGKGYIFVERVRIPKGKQFMAHSIALWNSKSKTIRFKGLLGDSEAMIPENTIVKQLWNNAAGRIQLGSVKYDRG